MKRPSESEIREEVTAISPGMSAAIQLLQTQGSSLSPGHKDKAEAELVVNIKKATNPEETAPKQKHVRSTSC